MWIVWGNSTKTERVQGGRKIERHCAACNETAMFYERHVTKTVQLYFINVYDYKTQRVMACGACGALYSTDELGAPLESPADASVEPGNVVDSFMTAAQRAGQAIQHGASAAIDEIGSSFAGVRKALRDDEPAHPVEPRPTETEADPLSDEDAALMARFAELERKPKPKAE